MKKSGKLLTLLLSCVMACGMAAFTGCKSGGDEIKTDPTKTQLYIFNFDSGYGTAWFNSLISRFETAYANESFETGKTGVQIIPDNRKEWFTGGAGSIVSSRNELFYTEYMYFQAPHTDGAYADITEAVTTPLTEFGENKSIVDKMTAQQREYFSDPVTTATGEGQNGAYDASQDTRKYYALPHYAGYEGIVYNIDLFDARGYYFSESRKSNPDINERFTDDKTDLTAGPDGTKGTDDDGLPATYDDFYMLCDFIAADSGRAPLTWTGKNYKTYVMGVQTALHADYEGAEQMRLNFSLNGTATSLLKTSDLTPDAPLAITPTNAYELSRQAGRYYGTSFIEKVVKTSNWRTAQVFNSGVSQTDAQTNFVSAGYDGKTNDIAMLIDGCWWENEARSNIADVASRYGAPDGKTRKFGWMPLPKANAAKVEEAKANLAANGKSQTLYDTLMGQFFMNSSIADWKKPLAEKFIRFAHTDESLRDFSRITSSLKAFEYELTEDDMNSMTEFGRSLHKQRKKADVVYPQSKATLFSNNQSKFERNAYYGSTVGGKDWTFAAEAFFENKHLSAEEFFKGMITYQRKLWNGME